MAAAQHRTIDRRRRRGATLVYGFFILLAVLAIGTLAVDYGHVQLVKTQLQRAADVTARGCIENYLRRGLSSAQGSAAGLASANPVDAGFNVPPTVTVTWGYWDAATNAFVAAAGTPVAVRVDARRTAATGNAVPVLLPIFTTSGTGTGRANPPSCDVVTSAVAIAHTRPLFDYSAGFGLSGPQPTLVNSAAITATRLRITPALGNKNGAAWSPVKVSVGCFTTSFALQFTTATADGICFVIQSQSPTAMGTVGVDLGYGGIARSLAVKFDIYNNAGEGTNSTGVFTNGTRPTVPSIDLTPSGVVLRNGHTYNVTLNYDGTTLSWTITDATDATKTMTNSSIVNLPAVIGGSTAYVGFVGSTGGSLAQQDVLTWVYSITTPRMVK